MTLNIDRTAANLVQAELTALFATDPVHRSRWPIGFRSGPFPSYANEPAWEVIGVEVEDGLAVAARPKENVGAALHSTVAPPNKEGVYVQDKEEGPLRRVRDLTFEERHDALMAPVLQEEHEQWYGGFCRRYAELENARQLALGQALTGAVVADPGGAVQAAIAAASRWGGEPFWRRVMRARTLTKAPTEARAPKELLLQGLEQAVGDGFVFYKVTEETRDQWDRA